MPPNAVKTIRDTIYWQYAKLIAKSAGMNIFASRGFQMKKFKELQEGKIKWSSSVTEWLRELEKPNECVYCGAKENLSVEHILPKCCGGPDITDNTILICKSCNSKKGGKRLYEYFKHDKRDEIPRIAEGKYLKLLYQMHEKAGTLDVEEKDLKTKMCSKCDMSKLCKEAKKEYELNVYCLEGCWKK